MLPLGWNTYPGIVIAKPGKPQHEAASYWPISLLPVMSKLFEKLLNKRLKPIIERRNPLPNQQFGFRSEHSTIDWVHWITNIVEKALEGGKKDCSAVFLDVAQAFGKVRHKGLNCKLGTVLPKQCAQILESYLAERFFRVKQGDAYSVLNSLNTKRRLLYLKTQFVPRSKHFSSRL